MSQSIPAFFVADSPGLDFLNSVATPAEAPIDWLDDGEGLLAWLAQSGLVSAQVVASMRKEATADELDRVAAQARDLREWFRGFVHRRKGRTLDNAALNALKPLNQLLARDEGFGTIVAASHNAECGLAFERSRRWTTPESLLLPIGEALAQLVCEEDFNQVKACEGPTCTLLFADHTRGHKRRWCSMSACGNRAKQAAHRHRVKAQG